MGFFNTSSGKNENTPLILAKQNLEMVDMELGRSFNTLGRMAYQMSTEGHGRLSCTVPEYQALVSKLTQIKANREAYYSNFLQLQGLMECQSCGKQIPYGSVFCPQCGKKANEKVEENISPDSTAFCTACGASVSKSMAFCTSCGNKMK